MNMFNLQGKNAVILGGAGVLGSAMSRGLAYAGAGVAVCSLHEEKAVNTASEIAKEGVKAKGYKLDVTDLDELNNVCKAIIEDFGRVDILVNAVGGNMKGATTSDTVSFFDLPASAIENVFRLNLTAGVVMPSQVFGKELVKNPEGGVIINISSMNAFRPLTRVPGYSAAKAAVSNFTQWLAVDMAKNYGEKIRVNAIAPGFFLTEQNRFMLTNPENGELTQRGRDIIIHTPMGRFGAPEDLIGTLIWLASDASRFVTGVVVPVDGGFSAFSGV
ncbi:SDR family oxidoreductase [Pseudoclostridium thermosuccinogenes]|uniref:SDR family oxidoreductase n=1 Tax=Clostridium thermosuccinogenes TaxID=84032 RepID=UPI002FD92C2C